MNMLIEEGSNKPKNLEYSVAGWLRCLVNLGVTSPLTDKEVVGSGPPLTNREVVGSA